MLAAVGKKSRNSRHQIQISDVLRTHITVGPSIVQNPRFILRVGTDEIRNGQEKES